LEIDSNFEFRVSSFAVPRRDMLIATAEEPMDWIQTYTGRKFFPLAPRAADIDIRDIAHALSLNCRFNGHCRKFYSVAEHSVRVSRALPREHALWGLLHDAGEAYLTDVPRPVKGQMRQFVDIEDRLLEVIVRHFGLSFPMPEPVRHFDEALLATEGRDLMAPPPEPWKLDAAPLAERIDPWIAEEAERVFLERFDELS